MSVDPTVDLGNILTIVAMLASLWTFHRQNTRRIHQIEFRVNLMWKAFAHRFNITEKLTDENGHEVDFD